LYQSVNLENGMTKAEALQQAEIALITANSTGLGRGGNDATIEE
jgi:CHAT domain-containing protein